MRRVVAAWAVWGLLGCEADAEGGHRCEARVAPAADAGCVPNLPDGWRSPDGGTPALPESTIAACRADAPDEPGTGLSRGAVECIARAAGLPEGLQPWELSAFRHAALDREVWSVLNTIRVEENCSESGCGLLLDAATGAILEWGRWDKVID